MELGDGQQSPEDALAKSLLEDEDVWLQGDTDTVYQGISDLLGVMVESGDLEIQQELTIETESGSSHVIRITDIDPDNSKAFYEIVPIKATEEATA